METYGTLDDVTILTLAPELVNSCDVIKELVARDVVVSVGEILFSSLKISCIFKMPCFLGHSMGDLKHGEAAVSCGASFITHLFNAMLPVCIFVFFCINV